MYNPSYADSSLQKPPVLTRPAKPMSNEHHQLPTSNNPAQSPGQTKQRILLTPLPDLELKRQRTKGLVLALAWLQLLSSLYMAASGFSCALITFYRKEPWFYTPVCLNGTGLYIGGFCFVAALSGIAYRYKRNDCFSITYMVLSLFAAFACGIEVILASIWTYHMARNNNLNPGSYYGDRDSLGLVTTNLTVNSILAIIAFVNVAFSLATFGLMCYNSGCCCEDTRQYKAFNLLYHERKRKKLAEEEKQEQRLKQKESATSIATQAELLEGEQQTRPAIQPSATIFQQQQPTQMFYLQPSGQSSFALQPQHSPKVLYVSRPTSPQAVQTIVNPLQISAQQPQQQRLILIPVSQLQGQQQQGLSHAVTTISGQKQNARTILIPVATNPMRLTPAPPYSPGPSRKLPQPSPEAPATAPKPPLKIDTAAKPKVFLHSATPGAAGGYGQQSSKNLQSQLSPGSLQHTQFSRPALVSQTRLIEDLPPAKKTS